MKAYHWYHPSVTDTAKTWTAFFGRVQEQDFCHNGAGPGKQACWSDVIEGPLRANEESLTTHRNYTNAALEVN